MGQIGDWWRAMMFRSRIWLLQRESFWLERRITARSTEPATSDLIDTLRKRLIKR
jgi:hypothetical protein